MYHVIINPASRSGKGKSVWQELETVLKAQNASYTAHFTNRAGDAKRFAEELTEAAQENVSLLVMGGDGTLNEVLQGICDFEKTALYYVPLGSGNDFARDYKESGTPAVRLMRLLQTPSKYRTDLGKARYRLADGTVHTHYFAVSAGIGYDAAVCAEVNGSRLKPWLNRIGLGKLVYLTVALRRLLGIPKIPCKVRVENGREILLKSFVLSAFMNHRYEGGGFMFAPEADAQDGLLDLCLVEDLSKLKILRVLPTAFKGGHVKYKEVHIYRGQTMSIKTDEPMYVHFDGEVPGKVTELEISCKKQMLNLYM